MKRSKLLTYVSEGLAALALAGTIFASTGHATFQRPQQTLEQRITKEKRIGNLAVLVIDMQEWFLGSIEYEEKHKEIPYQLEVLEYCKTNDIPVFVLEYKDCGPTVKILKDKVDSLEKKTYITKDYDDGFVKTDLAKQLRKNRIDTVLLMGINASACVLNTAAGAVMAGFNVMTSDDLIADPKSYNSNESIGWYEDNGIYRDDYKDLLDLISKEKYQNASYLLK
ncbi:MAG: isochorismatase family cysteine hydrolase [Nanoarchaeota archaeon]|nr:isochorismatase family cysteine hydrolase [Nanoarchaeota archaeon]